MHAVFYLDRLRISSRHYRLCDPVFIAVSLLHIRMFMFITNPSYAGHWQLHIAGVSDKLTDFTVGNNTAVYTTALLCIPTRILKSATSAEHQTLKKLQRTYIYQTVRCCRSSTDIIFTWSILSILFRELTRVVYTELSSPGEVF